MDTLAFDTARRVLRSIRGRMWLIILLVTVQGLLSISSIGYTLLLRNAIDTAVQGAADAFEWSFVAVPAQPKAGVLKHKGYHAMKELAGQEGWGHEVELLERQAELGRRYLSALRREVVRLNGLTGEGVEHAVMERIAGKLGEDELLELRRVYADKAAKRFPLMTQLDHGKQEELRPVDGAFLI